VSTRKVCHSYSFKPLCTSLWEVFYNAKKKNNECDLMPATHLRVIHVHHFVTALFLLITLCTCLGTEDINCCRSSEQSVSILAEYKISASV